MARATTIVDDAAAVAAAVVEIIEAVARAGPATGLLLSGAPALAPSYARAGAAGLDLAGVHVWYADEAAVAVTHPSSTHGAAARLWLDWSGATVHRIPGERGGIAAARAAATELRAAAGDEPAVDLAVLALGAAGETAALYPGDPAQTASGLYFPARGGTRITATLPLLGGARRTVIVATGAAVAAVCARILASPPSPDLPASLVAASGADVTWILDRAAARIHRPS